MTEYYLLINQFKLERPVSTGGPLDGAKLPRNRLVVMESIKQDAPNVRSEVVCVALDVRQQGVDINERRCFDSFERSHVIAFERINQQ